MSLFEGPARFSPTVLDSTQVLWVMFGGKHATSIKLEDVKYFFCSGPSDPWVESLARKATPVFHCRWITDAVFEKFPIPMAGYLLNPPRTGLEIRPLKTLTRQGRTTPSEPLAFLPMKRPYEQDTPDSPEHPRKKARTMNAREDIKERSLSTVPDAVSSSCDTTLNATAAHPTEGRPSKPQKIPFIDLVQMRRLRKATLDGKIVKKTASAPDLRRLQGPSSLALYMKDSCTPSIPVSVVLNALQDIKTDNCALVVPNRSHNGKMFRCDWPSSSS